MTTPDHATQDAAAAAARILSMTRATHQKLSGQVALVARALGRGPTGDELSLKSAKTVEALEATFAADAALATRVGDIVTKFEGVGAMLAEVDAEGPSEARVQTLKQSALFLGKFHDAMKGDPMLAQLFPPPQILEADASN